MTATTTYRRAETAAVTVKTIVTHNGIFHADDVFAVAILRAIFPLVSIVRTRDQKITTLADVAVDVGHEYNPARGRFDHHQWHGTEPDSRRKAHPLTHSTRYAAFGLVWKHYGRTFVTAQKPELEPPVVEKVADLVDRILVRHVDAADTGDASADEGFSISRAISVLNPATSNSNVSEEDRFDAFLTAVVVATTVLKGVVEKAYDLVQAREAVEGALLFAGSLEDVKLLTLDKYVPFQEQLKLISLDASNSLNYLAASVLLVVFPSADGKWMVQCTAPINEPFGKKLVTRATNGCYTPGLPIEWAGLNDETLEEVTGVEGSVFCHANRFICGAKTKEAALKLAEIALSLDVNHKAP